MRINKCKIGIIILSILMFCMILVTGCGKSENVVSDSKEKQPSKESSEVVSELQEINEIPEDGIITQAQLETVAGKDQKVSFHGTDASGIEYTWTFDCSQIQNPVEQNLKIDFNAEGLDDIKKQANNANDALMMTMYGKGLVCVPSLEVTLPESWKSDTVLLLKEQNGKLAKMSDVTIEAPSEETTKLVMNVTTLDGDCYIVGGIVNVQNPGADAANADKTDQADNSDNQQNDDSRDDDGGSDDTGGDVANDQSEDTALYCTISISCKTILNNMGNLTAGKEEFVPSNGWILKASEIEFTEGESVHDILKRVCKEAGIHMESSYSAVYDSAYVEGINQLYEFDCGELSGWMYSVNGWFPNYGCSKYTVKDGDVICWVYTCDLGKDVGDNSMY